MAREPKQKPGMPRSGRTGDGNIQAPPPGGFDAWRMGREPLPTDAAPKVRESDFVDEETAREETAALLGGEDPEPDTAITRKTPDPGGCDECVAGVRMMRNPAGAHLDPVAVRCACRESTALVLAGPAAMVPVVVEAVAVEPAPQQQTASAGAIVSLIAVPPGDLSHAIVGSLYGQIEDQLAELFRRRQIDIDERDRRVKAIYAARNRNSLRQCGTCRVVWGDKGSFCPQCGHDRLSDNGGEAGSWKPQYPQDVVVWRKLFLIFAEQMLRPDREAVAARPKKKRAARVQHPDLGRSRAADDNDADAVEDADDAPPPVPAAPKHLTASERARAAWGMQAV